MKAIMLNKQQWELHKQAIDKLLDEGRQVNLSYEPASKPVTRRQVSFFFAALVNQIYLYFRNSGQSITEKQIRYGLYKQVARVVPNMVYDLSMFGEEPQVKHISDMETAEEMSEFISGVFTVIDTNPIYEGLKLTPDTRYCWLNHLTHDELQMSRVEVLPEKDEDYLNYIREQPCIICGKQHRSDVHHIRDTRTAGMAIKSPDWYTIPLCHDCHMLYAHGTGFKEAMAWIKIDLQDFCRICYQRWKNKLN